MSKPDYPVNGVYEHYKSTNKDKRYYQVLGVARNTETEEKLVVYIPLYVIPEHKGLRMQVRPLTMFVQSVNYNGSIKPRFRYIGSEL